MPFTTPKQARAMGLAWFRKEDYQRIREISQDDMQPTFEAFEAKMARHLPMLEQQGIIVEKVMVDPDELIAFANRFFEGKIDTRTRSGYAGWRMAQKYGTDH